MLAANYTNVRDNFRSYCDKVIDDCDAVIITRKDNRNVVLISLDEYNNILENQFIMSNRKYYERLLESKKQIERDQIVIKTTEELEAMEHE